MQKKSKNPTGHHLGVGRREPAVLARGHPGPDCAQRFVRLQRPGSMAASGTGQGGRPHIQPQYQPHRGGISKKKSVCLRAPPRPSDLPAAWRQYPIRCLACSPRAIELSRLRTAMGGPIKFLLNFCRTSISTWSFVRQPIRRQSKPRSGRDANWCTLKALPIRPSRF